MINYGEELAYWFLRLNGCFPLTNLVLHAREGRHASDCDLLAVRPPHVEEAIGGPQDIYPVLAEYLEAGKTLGIVAEVKSGAVGAREVLPRASLQVALLRLGLEPDVTGTLAALSGAPCARTTRGDVVVKLLVAPEKHMRRGSWVGVSLEEVNAFVLRRMRSYAEKYRDRHFFGSNLLQYMIHLGSRG